jgi:hypothetical protein
VKVSTNFSISGVKGLSDAFRVASLDELEAEGLVWAASGRA